jgi:sterol desaturase/sphingolipid hydroxylase (fatty acid hydroxylase superfamily)
MAPDCDAMTMTSPPVPALLPRDPLSRMRPGPRTANALVALAVLITAIVTPSAMTVIALLFVVVVPFEKMFPRHRQPIRRPGLGTDIAYAVLTGPLKIVQTVIWVPVAVISMLWLPALALRPLVQATPANLRLVIGLILFDFLAYWAHRFAHQLPLLWRFHAIHHTPRHLDWIAGLRSHPLDGIVFAPVFTILLVAGFDPEPTGALVLVTILVQFFVHANVRWRLRPLHKIIVTPEFHHWHHCAEPQAQGSNHATLLPIWDLLFGTWYMPPGRRPGNYGVSEPIPDGLVHQMLHPLYGLGPRLRWALRHPWRAIRAGLVALWQATRHPGRPQHAPGSTAGTTAAYPAPDVTDAVGPGTVPGWTTTPGDAGRGTTPAGPWPGQDLRPRLGPGPSGTGSGP